MDSVPAPGHPLCDMRKMAPAPVLKQSFEGSGSCRCHAPADPVPVLFCRVGEAGCGRHSARCQHDETVYGCHLYRSDPARCSCNYTCKNAARIHRHLVCMASRLDHSGVAFNQFLSFILQTSYSLRLPDFQLPCRTMRQIPDPPPGIPGGKGCNRAQSARLCGTVHR